MTADPFAIFDAWYAEARASEPNDSNAMALATVGADGQPSVRMVLLKGHGPDGFVFFTNRESRKGAELAEGSKVALLFHWKSLRRQVRIEGITALDDEMDSDVYFATRARDSQLGAWASDQSRPLDSRATFEARFEAAKLRFEGQAVPRPPYWGGYRIVPHAIEFWLDREHRLHERRLFTRTGSFARLGSGWSEGLLYP